MATPGTAYVWTWLPGAGSPVPAGRLDHDDGRLIFTYGTSYLARADAVPLYTPELPLRRGPAAPSPGAETFGCIRDAAPDAWGQRVILSRVTGPLTGESDTGNLPLLRYLLESSSDRIGALDFQESPAEYVDRRPGGTLGEMMLAAEKLQAGEPLSAELDQALLHGTSIGGARPKATLVDGDRRLIAKFSSSTDPYPVVRAEAVAMDLARRVGLDVPGTELVQVLGRDVLLVDRFDRGPGGTRRMMVSALTVLGLTEMTGRYATYPDLADALRRLAPPELAEPMLHELFRRIVFNVCVGNIDDHPRNHAMFWDGEHLSLTPAYDVCPQPRSGGTAAQAMAVGRGGERASRLSVCIDAAAAYLLKQTEALDIVEHQVTTIKDQWDHAADTARLSVAERRRMTEGPARQILNPFIWESG